MSRDHEYVEGKIAVTGAAHIVIGDSDAPCDPMPYLSVKKLRKYMGKQDDLAVTAACSAAAQTDCLQKASRDRIGLYLGVGHIPFQQKELTRLATAADDNGHFSMQKLSTTGFHAVNGLLTFQCLPNMPAFHVSTNLDIQGPCYVSYPDAGQFYTALLQAIYALNDETIDVAVVLGVADRNNFLVQHHFKRLKSPIETEHVDSAGCLIMRRTSELSSAQPSLAHLDDLIVSYIPFDPFDYKYISVESTDRDGVHEQCSQGMGPASLPVLLSQSIVQCTGRFAHHASTADGFAVSSHWRLA